MKKLSNKDGIIAAAAMDQRGSLQKSLATAKGVDQKTITWHELQPGDSAFLRDGADGPVLELDDWRFR